MEKKNIGFFSKIGPKIKIPKSDAELGIQTGSGIIMSPILNRLILQSYVNEMKI